MKKYILPENVLMGILAYLESRPYKEVAAGIYELSRLEEYQEKERNAGVKERV